MSKATEKELGLLHKEFATELRNRLKMGESDYDPKTGEVRARQASAATLSVIRGFLKDNNIEAAPGDRDMTQLRQTLAQIEALPFDEDSRH